VTVELLEDFFANEVVKCELSVVSEYNERIGFCGGELLSRYVARTSHDFLAADVRDSPFTLVLVL
jgi:hypothetical protein